MPLITPVNKSNSLNEKQLAATPPEPDVVQVYQTALRSFVPGSWDANALSLVSQMIQWLIANPNEAAAESLWQWSKQLKEEDETLQDNGIVATAGDAVAGEYRRAIRLTIYYCRAKLSQNETDRIKYYRKCLAIPTNLETQQHLQRLAEIALERPFFDTSDSGSLPPKSRTSSVSSGGESSSSLSCCANCGMEKRAMPVCARCKSRAYCNMRCLKADKAKHELTCSK
ncbi:hypothetical protein DFQ28_009236 [Apophysomyces sp. BC1034]|nr:hypothetical protein DFQ30_008971 [Apophysomyces sp. BC1015]KAG0173395.1 hypothetical protein DFQ29_007974 [Apophysomyces sp. BC1021]KAG0192412.1 hypothetical protein DFQ28_009236 [Apophysomyces sp. BC1034]